MPRLVAPDLARRFERFQTKSKRTPDIVSPDVFSTDTKLFFSWWWLHWLGLPEVRNRHALAILTRLATFSVSRVRYPAYLPFPLLT